MQMNRIIRFHHFKIKPGRNYSGMLPHYRVELTKDQTLQLIESLIQELKYPGKVVFNVKRKI